MATKQESVVNQENNYYDEVDQILSNQYITIGLGEKKVTEVPSRKGYCQSRKNV
ncbi:MAG: hypothetical protein WCF23_15975 [Candidatus Nitrosopolaris sp.]